MIELYRVKFNDKPFSFVKILCVISLLLSSDSYNYTMSLTQFEEELSEEQALEIALSNPEVAKWLQNYDLISQEIGHGYTGGYWLVELTTSNDTATILVKIIIKGATESVISISYTNVDVEDSVRTEIENKAIEFFLLDPISTDFVSNNFDIWANLGSLNIVYIKGDNTTGSKKLRFRTTIGFNSTPKGDLTFHFIKIESDVSFGDLVTSTDEIRSLIDNNTDFSEFTIAFPDYSDQVKAVLYYNSPYNSQNPGYVYEIRYSNINNHYFEYRDENYIKIIYSGYNPRVAVSRIILQSGLFIEAEINATTLNFTNIDSSFHANCNTTQLLDLAFEHDDIKTWIQTINPFYAELYYLGNAIFRLDTTSLTSSDIGKFYINVTSIELSHYTIDKSVAAKMDPKDIYSISEEHPEVIEFKERNEFVNRTILYDTTGTWRVEFYNPTIDVNTAKVYVNDTTGEIIEVISNIKDPAPRLTFGDIVEITLSTNFQLQYSAYPDSRLTYYLQDNDYWKVYIY